MFGVIVNTLVIIVMGVLGSLIKKGFPEEVSTAVMKTFGIVTLYIGISDALKGNVILVVIISCVIGTVIGTMLDLKGLVEKFGEFLKKVLVKDKSDTNTVNFVNAFVEASVLFAIGSMAVIGSINASIKNDNSVLFVKSLLDGVSAFILAPSMGIGVPFSAASVFVVEGAIALFATFLVPLAQDAAFMAELSCVGGLLIVGISLNIIFGRQVNVVNMMPSIVVLPFIYYGYMYVVNFL